MPTDVAHAGDDRLGFAQSPFPSSRPTGFRRLTPAHLATARRAEAFAGLPAGISQPFLLLAALKAAAPALGLPPRLVLALDALFRLTRPQDWQAGCRPIVWPSLRTQQHELGLGPTQVKAINRQLAEFGLVVMRDSPNGKRYGHRDAAGRITEAYGFDLSPLALRHPEFVAAAAADRAERAEAAALRRRATIARKGIVQILETAAEHQVTSDSALDLVALAEATKAITAALRRAELVADIEAGLAALERRQEEAAKWLNAKLNPANTDPLGSEYRPHNRATNPASKPQATVTAQQTCKFGPGPGVPGAGAGSDTPIVELPTTIAPDELIRLAPRLGRHVSCPRPGWPEIVDAADGLRHELGISRPLWGEACRVMGRERAAVAIAIIGAKPPEHFERSAGGYFHGMVRKDRAGELHLDRTLYGLRRQQQREARRCGNGDGGAGR